MITYYRHYKGGLYKHVCEAIHSETGEDMIIYTCLESGKVYARPARMFDDVVDVNGWNTHRFLKLKESEMTKDNQSGTMEGV